MESEESTFSMLANFDISDESESEVESKESRFNDAQSGQLFLIGDWFMQPTDEIRYIVDELDILLKQVGYYVWQRKYKEAFLVYKNILDKWNHKGGRRRETLDGMVYCAMRGGLQNELKDVFTQLKNDVASLSDQINLWTTTIAVAEHGTGIVSEMEHLISVVYLCTLIECGRHWTMFDKISINLISKVSNFRIGAKVRAFFLLKQEQSAFVGASDSMEKLNEKQMVTLKQDLQANYTEDQIVTARNHMCSDLVKLKSVEEMDHSTEPPPHACKSDGIVKNDEELADIRRHFVSRFPWLFNDNPSIDNIILNFQ